MATLADVVDRLKQEGDLNRNSGSHSIKSLKETVTIGNELLTQVLDSTNQMGMVLISMFESDKEMQAKLLAAQALRDDESPARNVVVNQGETVPEEPGQDGKGGGLLGGLLAGMGLAGIASAIMGGISSAIKLLFNPRALLRAIGKLALRFSPLAIITGVVAAISGAVTEFFQSDKETLLGKIGDALGGAIGQVVEFFSFGLIKKEEVQSYIAPLTDFFEDLGFFFRDLFQSPGKALETAQKALVDVREFFANVLGKIWENLGLDELTKELFGIDVSGKEVTRILNNFFSSQPEEGYFSAIVLIKDAINSVGELAKQAFNFTENVFDGIFGEGSFSDFIVKPFKAAINYVSEQFDQLINDPAGFFKDVMEGLDDVVFFIKTIPDRLLFTLEEMYIDALEGFKINMIKFNAYLASIPSKLIIAAQQLVLDTVGTFAARQIGITPERIAEQREALADQNALTDVQVDQMRRMADAQRSLLDARRQEALTNPARETGGGVNVNAPSVRQGDSNDNRRTEITNNNYTTYQNSLVADPAALF